ncbi:2-oxo acid dehydrogenase subunit E2, partial [Vibrio diabolicus]|uniref:2-oxo acid dehydrogenase subunit E2 n=1 Tax=Vibrio diabolicus TaxID=50719 RepID=UPI00211B2024|nr:2-oxo acid dehydrogenase subunit E2 [Vibrio diabolicus]
GSAPAAAQDVATPAPIAARSEKRVPMTRLRKRVAERLLEAKNSTAMLTTFNEVNMKPIMDLRKQYQDVFEKKHGIRLGFMSFYVKAVTEALKRYPEVNASIDGSDIVYHNFFDISIAVSTPRGLVTPVLKDSDTLGMQETHFANVHGLDDPNLYSTPYDMALLGQALIRDVPDEYKIYSQQKFTYNGITQYNRNGLLWDKSMNVDGIKTGHTSNAGYSLVSSATEGKMRLIAVVMGTKDMNARKSESKKLLSYGFRFFETVAPHKAGETFVDEKI